MDILILLKHGMVFFGNSNILYKNNFHSKNYKWNILRILYFSLLENNYLDLYGRQLTNKEFDKYIRFFEHRYERTFIKYINIVGNRIKEYKESELMKIFPNVRYILTDDEKSISKSPTPQLTVIL